MLRSIKVLASGSVFLALVACGGSDGVDGKSALSTLSPEPAGAACPSGGTRIGTGFDADGNGALDPAEVKSSQVICNGSGASALMTSVEVESKGANCVAGGIKILSGADADKNAILDASEVTATKFVCNGDASPATGIPAVSAFLGTDVAVNTTAAATVHQATITAPGKGKVIAFFNGDLYCGGGGFACNVPLVTGSYTLTTSPTAAAASGSYEYFHLSPNATENTARSAVFDVAAAGDVTVFLRANAGAGGQYGFYRSQLTLVFVPG